MKSSKFILLAFLSISLVFLSSCKEDPEDDISPYIGNYIITNAALSETLTLTTNEIGDIVVPVDTPITLMIQEALTGSTECEPEESIIQLLEDYSLILSCLSPAPEVVAGTWQEQSETVIILNMNSTAIPSSPTGVVLTISGVTLANSILSGETTVPISKDMLAGIVTLMSNGLATLDMEATPAAVPVTFIIKLQKQ